MTRSAPSSLPIASRSLRVPVRITGLAPSALATATASSPIGPGADHHDALAGNQAAQFGQAVHRRSGGDDQRRFGIAHRVGHPRQRVDVVDGVFGKAAIGGKAVGAMALVGLSVVQARGVHALAAALALAAAGMDLDADALADPELVDVRSERRDRPHIFVARREILVEGQAAQDARRRPGWMISRSVAQIATASIRTRTSARAGTGVGFSRSKSSSGSPSTQAFIRSGTGRSDDVVTPDGPYMG